MRAAATITVEMPNDAAPLRPPGPTSPVDDDSFTGKPDEYIVSPEEDELSGLPVEDDSSTIMPELDDESMPIALLDAIIEPVDDEESPMITPPVLDDTVPLLTGAPDEDDTVSLIIALPDEDEDENCACVEARRRTTTSVKRIRDIIVMAMKVFVSSASSFVQCL